MKKAHKKKSQPSCCESIFLLPKTPFQFSWKLKCYTFKQTRLHGVHKWIEREFVRTTHANTTSKPSFLDSLNSYRSTTTSVGPVAESKSKGHIQGRVVDIHSGALVDLQPLNPTTLQRQELSPNNVKLFQTMLQTHPQFNKEKKTVNTLLTQLPRIHPSALRCYHLLSTVKKLIPVQAQLCVGSTDAFLGTGIDQVWFDPQKKCFVIVELKMHTAKEYTFSNTTLKHPCEKKAASPFNLHQLQAAMNLWLFKKTFHDVGNKIQQRAIDTAVGCVVRVDAKQAEYIPVQAWVDRVIENWKWSATDKKNRKRKQNPVTIRPKKKKRKTKHKKKKDVIFSAPLPQIQFPLDLK